MQEFLRACVFTIAFLVAGASWAQTSDAAARALFEDGRALMEQGKFAEACAKFEGSQKLEAKASTALNLGVCYAKQNKFATAWSTFGTAAALAKRAGHRERETFAREQMAAMEGKLARLTIHVGTEVAGLEVSLDGKPLIAAMFGTALPIDPGEHRLSATAPGKKPWSKALRIPAEGASLSATVPMLEDDEAAAAVPGVAAVPGPDPASRPPGPSQAPGPTTSPDGTQATSLVAYIGFSVAAVGIIVGGIAGVVAISNTATIVGDCNDEEQCPSSLSDDIASANTVANVSNVGFAVGAAGLIVGIIGLFVGGDDGTAADAAGIRPLLSSERIGLQGSF